MKKLTRVLLFALGAIVACAAVVLLAVNLYVQSQGTQKRIQHELSQRLGTPLHIRRMSVTPWSGLRLSGITIPQTDLGLSGQFLEAKTFRLRVKFASLFSQPLIIKEISLVSPTIVWTQNSSGKWRLPALPVVANPSQMPAPSVPEAPVPSSVESSVAPAAPEPSARVARAVELPAPKEPSTSPEVRRVNVLGGSFHFLDEKARVVALFDNVQFHSDFRRAADVRGNISIGKTSLRDRFFLEQLQSPLEYGPTVLDFSRITAQAAGGKISGRYTMHPEEQESPFNALVEFKGLQADRVLTDAGGSPGTLTGQLEGRFDASGKTSDPNALSGKGEIFLHDGEVRQYSLLVALAQLTQITELQRLHLDQAQVKFHVDPGVVTVDELILRSPNIRVTANGTITFEGQMLLTSQLAVNEKIRGQLFRAVRNNFQPTEEPGYASISFEISGTVARPRTNLMEKLVGRDLGGVLNSLLGRSSDRAKKKISATPTPTPTPTPEEIATPTPTPTP